MNLQIDNVRNIQGQVQTAKQLSEQVVNIDANSSTYTLNKNNRIEGSMSGQR